MSLDSAVVLAAGEGTRLRPLPEHVSKPLFPVADGPLTARTAETASRPVPRGWSSSSATTRRRASTSLNAGVTLGVGAETLPGEAVASDRNP